MQRNLPGDKCRDGKDPGQTIHLHQPGERYGCGGDPGGEDALSSSSYGPGAYARPGRAGEGGLTKLICRFSGLKARFK